MILEQYGLVVRKSRVGKGELISAGLAAQLLDVSAEGLRWFVRKGELPFIPVAGGRRVYRRQDVEELKRKRDRKRTVTTP